MSGAAPIDAPRTPATPDPAFRNALTFAFGDPATGLYGRTQTTLAAGAGGGMAIVYSGGAPLVATTEQDVAVAGDAPAWQDVAAAGVRSAVEAPLAAWTVRFEHAAAAFDLRFEALSDPVVLAADSPVAQLGGLQGADVLCAVSGTVRRGARTERVRCLGQRSHLWGVPSWERIALARTLTAWLGADRAVTLHAARPARARHHDDEAIGAWVIERGAPIAIADPRLSTTYDAQLRQRRAALELWLDDDDAPALRAGGEVVCGTTTELGAGLTLQSAFMRWRMAGREGVGRYDVLRRASAGSRRR